MKRFLLLLTFLSFTLYSTPDLVEKAVDAYQDQNEGEAFRIFIDSLSSIQPTADHQPGQEEKVLYEQALKLYLENHGTAKLNEISKKIITDYGDVVESHPDYAYLDFLVAAAYANQGNFEEFFPRFYKSFQKCPQSYMAYRTLAILHLKLLGKTPESKEREQIKEKISSYACKASQKYPQDISLYRLMITYSKKEKREEVVRESLRKILEENMMIPRKDVSFFTKSALETNQEELAAELVAKAKGQYSYSRMIEKAERMIKRHKNRSK